MKVVLIAVLVLLTVVPTATMWTQDHEIYGEASQQIKNGHLPLEYLIVGGDFVSVCVIFWFYFRFVQ